MKRMTAILMMALILTAYSVVPAFAFVPPRIVEIDSLEKLEQLNSSAPGKSYAIKGTVTVDRKVELSFDHSIVLSQHGTPDSTIVIEDGGELVIDAPEVKEVYTNGHYALINVKPGGKLVLKRGSVPGTAIIGGVPTIVVEEGGICELYSDFEVMLNELHTFEDAISGKITEIGEEEHPDIGGEKPLIPEIKDKYTGKIVCMDKEHQMSIFFTVPALSDDISNIRIERKIPEMKRSVLWETLCTYEREYDNETPENIVFKYLVPKLNPDDGEKPYTEYFSWRQLRDNVEVNHIRVPEVWNEELAGKTVSYRLVYEYKDGIKADFETDEICIVMPETGEVIPYTSGTEYGDTGGNRSGIGQGESERNPIPLKPETKPETEIKPEVKPETKPEPEVKPEVKPETKPEPEVKPEVKPETKPEPEVKPEVKPETKPEQNPTASSSIEVPSEKTDEEVKYDADGETAFHEDNTSIYKQTVTAAGALPGVVIATTATVGVAGGAYAVTKVIKKRKRR